MPVYVPTQKLPVAVQSDPPTAVQKYTTPLAFTFTSVPSVKPSESRVIAVAVFTAVALKNAVVLAGIALVLNNTDPFVVADLIITKSG